MPSAESWWDPRTVRQSLCFSGGGRGRTTAQAGSGQHHEGGPDFVLGELFAAGSGPSSWRSEVDFGDIWAGPGRKDRILSCGDGERLFQAERMCEPVGQWENEALGRAERTLLMSSLHPITLNFVLSGPTAASALTFQPSGIFPPLENVQFIQLSQVMDAFPEFFSHVPTPTSPQKPH